MQKTLGDAAEVVLACCAGLDGPIRLVGRSYGGAVALWAARTLGTKVSRLALYEPMLPGLLRPQGCLEGALREIAELLARQYPRWQFEHLDGCGHMAPLTHADEVNRRLAAFLQDLPVAAPA